MSVTLLAQIVYLVPSMGLQVRHDTRYYMP